VQYRRMANCVVQGAERPTTHIAHDPVLQIEKTNEIVSVGAMRTSRSAKIVPLRCTKTNVQTNTSRAQREASVSSLYLAVNFLLCCSYAIQR